MKKTTSASRSLPSVICDLAEVEALVAEVRTSFGDADVHQRIKTEVGKHAFEFEDFGELRAEAPASQLREFKVSLYAGELDDDRDFRLSLREAAPPSASATAASSGWVAGNLALAADFGRRNRTWYSFLPMWLVWTAFYLYFVIPSVLNWFGRGVSWVAFGAWILAGLCIFWILVWGRRRWFPNAVVVLEREPNFLKRHVAEISAIGTIVSAIAAIAALVVAASNGGDASGGP